MTQQTYAHLLVLQNNERRYNASIGEGHTSDLRDKATETGGRVGPHWVQGGGSRAASSLIFLSSKLMKEDTTLVSAKATQATSETGLPKQRAKWDPTGAKWRIPCCVFLHLLVSDTTPVWAKATQVTLETGLQKQWANWDPTGANLETGL